MQGGSFWKAGKRDECYNVYVHACEDAMEKLKKAFPALRAALAEAIANARSQSGAQGKSKGAQILRKAMDLVVIECDRVSSVDLTPCMVYF